MNKFPRMITSYHAVTRAHPRRSGASDAWSCLRTCVQFILGGRRFTVGRRGDAPQFLVPKGLVAAKLAEITQLACTVPAQPTIATLSAIKTTRYKSFIT